MAQLIQENGQESNGVVYEQSGEDGKHYTLLSGERRLKAITKNYEEGKGDGLMDVKVVPKPQDDADEYLRLIRNNAQRNKSKQIREKDIMQVMDPDKDLDGICQGSGQQGKSGNGSVPR